jgi:hypothetical protein
MSSGGDVLSISDTFLAWFSPGKGWSGNWVPACGLFAAGVFGAFITMYLTDPETLPQLGGGRSLPRMRRDVDFARTAWLAAADQLRRADAKTPAVDYQRRLDRVVQLRDQFSRLQGEYAAERRLTLFRGIPLFCLLAGGLALLLGHNVLEAIAVGGAWPAFLKGLGLQRESDTLKDQAADIAQSEVEDLEKQLGDLGKELEKARAAEQQANGDKVIVLNAFRVLADDELRRTHSLAADPAGAGADGKDL